MKENANPNEEIKKVKEQLKNSYGLGIGNRRFNFNSPKV